MTRLVLAFAFLSFALGGLVPADEKKDEKKEEKKEEKKDEKGLKELEGTYKLVHAERDGKAAEKALVEAVTVTIKGDEFIMSFSADDKKVSKIKVAPDAKLSTIELVPQDGTEKGKTFPGIYKLDKSELTLAFSEKGDRPKEFKSDNEAILLRLKKVEK
jgi:uncharacterized protein (TIGR03067 family)